MLILAATQKALKEIEVEPVKYDIIPKNLNTWHMNLFKLGRYKCLVLMNDLTLYSVTIVGVKKKEFKNLNELLRKHLSDNLLAEDIEPELIENFLEASKEIVYTKTHNRSVLGCMKDSILIMEYLYSTEKEMFEDPIKINDFNNHTPYSPIKTFPIRLFKQEIETYNG